ncbi:hypothetical protein ACJX0J_029597 [Zea mays]
MILDQVPGTAKLIIDSLNNLMIRIVVMLPSVDFNLMKFFLCYVVISGDLVIVGLCNVIFSLDLNKYYFLHSFLFIPWTTHACIVNLLHAQDSCTGTVNTTKVIFGCNI